MKIIPLFDSSVSSAPAGFMTAVNAAIDYIDQTIIDPITVKITFSYGELQGQKLSADALGESSTNGYIEPYSQVVSWLTQSATSQADAASLKALPASDPTNGGMFWVSDAEAAVFGDSSNPNFTDPQDGFVALSSTAAFTFDPTNRAVAGEYDAIGVIEHEITEAIGRISYLGEGSFDNMPLWAPLDLFRYSSPGVHELTPASGFFSVNGQNLLLEYNNPKTGDDAGDWTAAALGDAFGFGITDHGLTVSATDLLEMDLLGFKISQPVNDDFNDDQNSDILIENASGAVDVGEYMGGSMSFAQVAGLGPEWSFHGSGDFFGDGNLGFLVQNTGGAVDVGEVVGGHATFTQVAALGPEWKFGGVGDFLGDGLSDFLIQNAAGAVDIGEVVGGLATFTQVASLGPEWKFVAAGDFMGDGQSDFLIENTAGAVDVGEVVGGQTTFTNVGSLGPEWKFVGAGDFLAVGDDQFLIQNTSGAVDVAQVIDGVAHYTQVAALGSEWKFVGAGDFLGEGHEQFLIENTAGAVDVGDWNGSQIHFTQITSLGSEWSFHL
jgi:hypothetical protein